MFQVSTKKFIEKLLSNTVNGKCFMDTEDVVIFSRLMGFACSAIGKSETTIVQLQTRNTFLESDCSRLQWEKRDISRKYEQKIRKLKEEIVVRERQITDLTDGIRSMKAENERKDSIRRKMQKEMKEQFVRTRNELEEGKTIITAQINKFEGGGKDLGNLRFSELIGLLVMRVIRLKKDEDDEVIEYIRKMQCTVDGLRRENENLTVSTEAYKNKLVAKEKICVDNDKLIETLQLNIIERGKNEMASAIKYSQAVSCLKKLTSKTISLI